MQAFEPSAEPLVVAGQPAEAAEPREAAPNDPPPQQQHEPRLASWCLYTVRKSGLNTDREFQAYIDLL